MKKVFFYLVSALVLISFQPLNVAATTNDIAEHSVTVEPPASERVIELLARLDEIKVMDKSDLSSAERKELRSEVRAIRAELSETGNGVYLSVGAIIIIILLLVLLL